MATGPLGIRRLDSVDFVVHDIQRSRAFYEDKMDFRRIATCNDDSVEASGENSDIFEAGRVRVQCTAPKEERDSRAATFLRSHPDGIRTLRMRVDDVEATWKALDERGANIIDEPSGQAGDRYRSFAIATPLGDVEFEFVQKQDDALFDPALSAVVGGEGTAAGDNQHALTHMDHVTSNTRDMRSLTNWYRDVLGFEHFWDIQFHTQDSDPDMEGGSGLRSIVMWDPHSNIKFATNEPLAPAFHNSQIQKFVEDNHGPGVQHIALSTGQIMDTVPAMRKAGLTFLETPDAYYEMLPERMAERAVTNLKEDIETLRKDRILVDGSDDRYLLQIFMQEAALMYDEAAAGPFFYEVIQRHGEQGFGEGNFRALFESIERQQAGETQRTTANPYLVD